MTGNSAGSAGSRAATTDASWSAVARQRRRAAGIYGTIVTAAVMAAAGSRLPTLELETSILVTLLVLLLVRAAGTSAPAAANAGLISALVLLVFYDWSAGRAADLRGARLLFITSIAAVLGLLMIVLKNVVLVHMH